VNSGHDEPMGGFTALCTDAEGDTLRAYALLYAGREWPDHAAVTHLRILESERRTGRRKASEWPTVRQLAEAWGWKTPKGEPAKDRAAAFLTRTRTVPSRDGQPMTVLHWQDGFRHTSLEELRGDRAMGVNRPGARRPPDGGPTGARREPDGGPTAETEQASQSEGVSDGGPTAARREPDGSPTPRASSPRASTDPPITDHRDQEPPLPPEGGELVEDGRSAPKAEPPPLARKTPDHVATLWSVFRGYQPRRDPTPSPGATKALRRLLTECRGLDGAGIYLAWVHTSQDRWARQLRGEEPWPDGAVIRRMDPESLARNLGGRFEQAEAWDRAGRPTGPARAGPGPPGTGPPKDRNVRLLERLGRIAFQPTE
jgi:hypothetical protein